jgi:hypothetical protein
MATIARLKRLVGIEFEYKTSLKDFFTTVLANKLVLEYNETGNTPALRASLLSKYDTCGASMGFSAKQFAYGVLELVVDALVNNPDVPTDPYANTLNDQLVNVTRYVGIAGEEDFHFMVAVYNLSVTLSEILGNVLPVGPLVTLGSITDGGSGYTVDGLDGGDATGVVFRAYLELADQNDPDQYQDASLEGTIVDGEVTAITSVLDGGDGFAVGDVLLLEVDTEAAGQSDGEGSGALVVVTEVA